MSGIAENKPHTLSLSAALPALGSLRLRRPDDVWRRGDLRFDAAAASVCAMLSFSAEVPSVLTANLKALGFDRLAVSALDNADPARIGLAIAVKRTPEGDLIAVVLRGTQGAEWYANFRIGFGQEHRGFALAADYAASRLRDYLRIHAGGGSPRFLITGYSRGGAAANLLARRLCDSRGVDAVRCYTFASPNTALSRRGACYDGIYNLVREEDFFTHVPLASWGYVRSGRTLTLGGDIRAAYRSLTGEDYGGYADAKVVRDALREVQALAPGVHAYYHRRYAVGDRMMSLYDYMMTAASLLAGDDPGDAGEILLDSAASPFAELTAFLSAGMDLTALLTPTDGLPRCCVADSHQPAAYLAAMKTAHILT